MSWHIDNHETKSKSLSPMKHQAPIETSASNATSVDQFLTVESLSDAPAAAANGNRLSADVIVPSSTSDRSQTANRGQPFANEAYDSKFNNCQKFNLIEPNNSMIGANIDMITCDISNNNVNNNNNINDIVDTTKCNDNDDLNTSHTRNDDIISLSGSLALLNQQQPPAHHLITPWNRNCNLIHINQPFFGSIQIDDNDEHARRAAIDSKKAANSSANSQQTSSSLDIGTITSPSWFQSQQMLSHLHQQQQEQQLVQKILDNDSQMSLFLNGMIASSVFNTDKETNPNHHHELFADTSQNNQLPAAHSNDQHIVQQQQLLINNSAIGISDTVNSCSSIHEPNLVHLRDLNNNQVFNVNNNHDYGYSHNHRQSTNLNDNDQPQLLLLTTQRNSDPLSKHSDLQSQTTNLVNKTDDYNYQRQLNNNRNHLLRTQHHDHNNQESSTKKSNHSPPFNSMTLCNQSQQQDTNHNFDTFLNQHHSSASSTHNQHNNNHQYSHSPHHSHLKRNRNKLPIVVNNRSLGNQRLINNRQQANNPINLQNQSKQQQQQQLNYANKHHRTDDTKTSSLTQTSDDSSAAAKTIKASSSAIINSNKQISKGQVELDMHGGQVVNSDGSERFSRKVFVGGLPPDIDEEEIKASFRRFGSLLVDWPHKAESKSYFPPKGYAFLLFHEEISVQALIEACIQDKDKLYLCVSSPTIQDKPVQIRPWRLSDADHVLDSTLALDPRKTVFVGGVPRPLKASELAIIMNQLYGGVCYAGIDTDPELKYPKGAGRVAFSNHDSYIAAIGARFVHLHHSEIDKRVEVKPYVLDDQYCDECLIRASSTSTSASTSISKNLINDLVDITSGCNQESMISSRLHCLSRGGTRSCTGNSTPTPNTQQAGSCSPSSSSAASTSAFADPLSTTATNLISTTDSANHQKFAPFFCANIICLRYYCESCWNLVHSSPDREFHKPMVKEGADRPRTIYSSRWLNN